MRWAICCFMAGIAIIAATFLIKPVNEWLVAHSIAMWGYIAGLFVMGCGLSLVQAHREKEALRRGDKNRLGGITIYPLSR